MHEQIVGDRQLLEQAVAKVIQVSASSKYNQFCLTPIPATLPSRNGINTDSCCNCDRTLSPPTIPALDGRFLRHDRPRPRCGTQLPIMRAPRIPHQPRSISSVTMVHQPMPFATSSGLSSTIVSSASFISVAYFARRRCSSVCGTNEGTGTGVPFPSTATNTTRQSVVCLSCPPIGSPACTDT